MGISDACGGERLWPGIGRDEELHAHAHSRVINEHQFAAAI